MPRITIKEVAARAGVSVGSVSRVLNGLPVSNKLQDKVRGAMEQLGYRPDNLARSLRTRSSAAVGCLVTDIANPFYGALIKVLEARLREHGKMLLLASSGGDLRRELALLDEFRGRRVDGLVLAPGSDAGEPLRRALARFEAPVSLLSGDLPDFPSVVADYHGAVRAATTHLLRLGHRRIALLTAMTGLWPGRQRIEGFRQAFRDAGDGGDPWSRGLPLSADAVADVRALLDDPAPPTALLVGARALPAALAVVRERGLRLPGDLSLISLADSEWASLYQPAITALHWDLDRVAEALIAPLLTAQPVAASAPVTVAGTLIHRGSCGVAEGSSYPAEGSSRAAEGSSDPAEGSSPAEGSNGRPGGGS